MDDMWDAWTFPHPDPSTTFPNGVRNAFDKLAEWNAHVAPGSWPDADMLPFGSLFPHAGWGAPRHSRLTQAETRTAFTLWSIARSPLILGGNLTEADPWLLPLLSNRAVIALNQGDRTSRPVETLPADLASAAKVWVSALRGAAPDTVAIFNVSEAPLAVRAPWSAFGLRAGPRAACDLWTGKANNAAAGIHLTIAPHDVALLRLDRCGGR